MSTGSAPVKDDFDHHTPAYTSDIPGTVVESADKSLNGRVLFPHPTQDPNDPLNWTSFEKYSTYLTVCFFTFLATVNGSNFTVAVVPVSKEFKQSATRAGFLVCFNVLLQGLANLFWIPVTRVIGKRPVFLFALLLFMGCNVWSYKSTSFDSLLAARIVSGFSGAAADATVPPVVTDLFFIHERGHCMMLFHLALSSGVFLGPLMNAYIVQYAGWRWMCGFLAIAAGITFLVGLFTIRESSYARESSDISLPASSYPPKDSWVSWLSVTRGYNKEASFVKSFVRIVSLVAYPPIIWPGLTAGAFVGWNIVVQLTASRTFTSPPYRWKIGSLGLMSIAGFIGTLLAFFLGGKLLDIISNRMTKRNHGKREPEFRLPAIVLPAFFGPMGILIFGLCVSHHTHWIGAAVGYAMQGFGITAVANVLVTFAVDGYQPLAGEALVVIFVMRGTIGTILALFIVNWEEAAGVQNTFGQMVAIQYALLLVTIPMFYYGKRIRSWTATFGPMKQITLDHKGL